MKLGRNDPCRCGSGKKYKRCCSPIDERRDREYRAAIPVPGTEPNPDGSVQVYTPLDLLSNHANKLIRDGRLDEADKACQELRSRYPDEIDWLERTAALCAARGDIKKAAEHYREAAAFARSHQGFEPEYSDLMLDKANTIERSETNPA